MFQPGRLIALAIFGSLIYMGFYQLPGLQPNGDLFDPASVAAHESAAWQAAVVQEDFSGIVSSVLYQRELHRMSWFRATESGMALSRAMTAFSLMLERPERIAPRLEEVVSIERTWSERDYDAAQVSRQQATWMALLRNARRNEGQRAASEMAEELGTRLGVAPQYVMSAAAERTDALRQVLPRNSNPDWEQVTLLLTRAYTNLNAALKARDANARPTD